ncbi:DUF1849 family protein [Nisaea sp.]
MGCAIQALPWKSLKLIKYFSRSPVTISRCGSILIERGKDLPSAGQPVPGEVHDIDHRALGPSGSGEPGEDSLKSILKLTALVIAIVAMQWVTPLSPAAASASQIVPHKALYGLSLKGAPGGNDVVAVGGQMAFEWRDACDGWAINQRNLMILQSAAGLRRSVDSTMTTWEAKDGSSFRFIVNKDFGAGGGEALEGKVQRAPSGSATASFTAPGEVDVELPVDVMFPSQHTIALLNKIAAGEKFFSAALFDGSEFEPAGFVSAAIGLEVVPAGEEELLIAGPYWPVRLAFYGPENETESPDYELAVDLHQNGIARRLEIHFKEFTVDVALQRLERLQPGDC